MLVRRSGERPSVGIICSLSIDYTGVMGLRGRVTEIKGRCHYIISKVGPITVTHRCGVNFSPRSCLRVSPQDGSPVSRSVLWKEGHRVPRTLWGRGVVPHLRGDRGSTVVVWSSERETRLFSPLVHPFSELRQRGLTDFSFAGRIMTRCSLSIPLL